MLDKLIDLHFSEILALDRELIELYNIYFSHYYNSDYLVAKDRYNKLAIQLGWELC